MTTPPTDKITFPIPDTAVEAAAAAIYEDETPQFEFANLSTVSTTRLRYVHQARLALAAALATGEVRQEWGRPDGNTVLRCDPLDAPLCANQPDEHAVRSVATFPDGSQWTSAWAEVSP